jgi:hypothetical protein
MIVLSWHCDHGQHILLRYLRLASSHWQTHEAQTLVLGSRCCSKSSKSASHV